MTVLPAKAKADCSCAQLHSQSLLLGTPMICICNFDFKMFISLRNDFLKCNEMNKQDNTQCVP